MILAWTIFVAFPLSGMAATTVYQTECEHKLVLATEAEYEVAVAYPLTSYVSAPTPARGGCTAAVAAFRTLAEGDVTLTHRVGEADLGKIALLRGDDCPRGSEPLLLAKRDALEFEIAGAVACLPEDYRYVPRSRLGGLSRHYRVVSSEAVSDVCGEYGAEWDIPTTDASGVLGCVAAP